jgi:hypothetical protein
MAFRAARPLDLHTLVKRTDLHLVLSQPCIVIVAILRPPEHTHTHTHTRFSPRYCRRLLIHSTPIRAVLCYPHNFIHFPVTLPFPYNPLPPILAALPVATFAFPGVDLKRHLRSLLLLLLPSASPPAAHYYCLLCTTTPSGRKLVKKLGSLIRARV